MTIIFHMTIDFVETGQSVKIFDLRIDPKAMSYRQNATYTAKSSFSTVIKLGEMIDVENIKVSPKQLTKNNNKNERKQHNKIL